MSIRKNNNTGCLYETGCNLHSPVSKSNHNTFCSPTTVRRHMSHNCLAFFGSIWVLITNIYIYIYNTICVHPLTVFKTSSFACGWPDEWVTGKYRPNIHIKAVCNEQICSAKPLLCSNTLTAYIARILIYTFPVREWSQKFSRSVHEQVLDCPHQQLRLNKQE